MVLKCELNDTENDLTGDLTDTFEKEKNWKLKSEKLGKNDDKIESEWVRYFVVVVCAGTNKFSCLF